MFLDEIGGLVPSALHELVSLRLCVGENLRFLAGNPIRFHYGLGHLATNGVDEVEQLIAINNNSAPDWKGGGRGDCLLHLIEEGQKISIHCHTHWRLPC